jgi:riboflavin kinase/FMN adenylyltransferase
MRVATGVDGLRPADGRLMVAIGVFDGLHRGHRYLLARLRDASAKRGAHPAVITFDAHPDAVITGQAPPLLLDPDERLARLSAAGVAVTVVQHFDDEVRRTPYERFVEAIGARVELAGFVMTPDAAFGFERGGTPTALRELGRVRGFEAAVVPPYSLDGEPVRSTDIRAAIAAGDLARARRLLGRRHAVVVGAGGADPSSLMPVALPPAGDYEARLGRPWRPGWHGRPVVVTVGQGSVRLPGPGPAPGGPVRVAFGRRLP